MLRRGGVVGGSGGRRGFVLLGLGKYLSILVIIVEYFTFQLCSRQRCDAPWKYDRHAPSNLDE